MGSLLLSMRADKAICVKAWLAEWRALKWQWVLEPDTAMPVLWEMMMVAVPGLNSDFIKLEEYQLQDCNAVSVEMEAAEPIYGLEIGGSGEMNIEVEDLGGLELWREMEEPVPVRNLWTNSLGVSIVEEVYLPAYNLEISATKCKYDPQFLPFRFQPQALACNLPGFQLELPACPPLSLPSHLQSVAISSVHNLSLDLLLTPVYHSDKDCKLLKHVLHPLEMQTMPSLWSDLPTWLAPLDLPERHLDAVWSDIGLRKIAVEPISALRNQPIMLTGLEIGKSTLKQKLIQEVFQELLKEKRPLPRQTVPPTACKPQPFSTPKPSSPAGYIIFNSESSFSSGLSGVISTLKPEFSLLSLPASQLGGLDILLSPAVGILVRTSSVVSSEEECSGFLKELDALVGKVRRVLVLCFSRPGPRLDQWRKLVIFGELVKDLDLDCYFEICFNESEVQDVVFWYLQQPFSAVPQLPAQPGPTACALTPVANIYTAMIIEQKALQGLIHPKALIKDISSPSDLQAISGL
jgi:hypothetical protein